MADLANKAVLYYESPIGMMGIYGDDAGISEISFENERIHTASGHGVPDCLTECASQLQEYFSKKRTTFSLKLAPTGTEFQRTVWNALLNVPFGKTWSYLQLAKSLGDANLIRAVGGANGKNPIAIVVPCHRIIGNDGKMVGYAGGLWRKKWLLDFERTEAQGSLF